MQDLKLILLMGVLASCVMTFPGITGAQDTTISQQQTAGDTTGVQPGDGNVITETIQKAQPKIGWQMSFGKLFWAIVIFFIAMIFIRYLSRFLETIGERWANLRLVIKRIIPVIRIAGWTFVLYVIIAGILAPPIETLIAVTASAGIAVGFASQDILKNIFGGIMILFDRPFQVGDKIEAGKYYGEVVQIGLRSVRIVTPDDSLVSIPNSELVNQAVSNANNGEFYCQVVAEFFLPAHIDIARVKKICYYSAAVSRYVYLGKPIAIVIKNEIHEGRSILKVRLKAYVLDLRYEFAFASDMTARVISRLLKERLVDKETLTYSGASGNSYV